MTQEIPQKFIKNLSGKEFVLFEGLLDQFHQNGGQSIETEDLSGSDNKAKFKATVTGDKGTFTGHGDADAENVNKMVASHMYRMAETRAIARALRLYNNIGMCSVEELGGDNGETKTDNDDL